MYDLESFFWVLFWVCIHYEGPARERIVPSFDKWNYMGTTELAEVKKGVISDEEDFLRKMEENFTAYYQPLTQLVNKLRRITFPGGARWKKEDAGLYESMKEVLCAAREGH